MLIEPVTYKSTTTTTTGIDKENLQHQLNELELKELEILRLIKKHKQDCPIEFFTRPNPPQQKLLEAFLNQQYKVFVFSGGNRLGKTTIGSILAICCMVGYFPWSNEPYPVNHRFPRKIRYIGQDWEKHIGQVVVPTLKKWYPHNRPVYIKRNVIGIEAYWRDEKTGSTLEIMSNKQEPDLHEGWDGDLVVYDEPPRREIRVANARGLVDRQGRELFCVTLLKESWIDKEIIKQAPVDNSIFCVHGSTYDNVGYGITLEGIKQFEKTLTEEEKLSRLQGIPSYLSGLIYPFEYQKHTINRFAIPPDWLVDIAIDVHPREKQAVLFIATSPTNIKYACFELWQHGTPEEIARQIVNIVRQHNLCVNIIQIDPLSKGDKNNINTIFDRFYETLSPYDLPLRIASKDKSAGILKVKEHFQNNSFFIFNDLKRTIYEIEGYMWDEDKQQPQDKDDHMMENLYRIMLIDTNWHYNQQFDEDDDDYNYNSNEIYGRNELTGY